MEREGNEKIFGSGELDVKMLVMCYAMVLDDVTDCAEAFCGFVTK